MRVTSKGQITLPKEIRKRAGLRANTEVECSMAGDCVFLRKVKKGRAIGRKGIDALIGTGDANLDLSTDDIMRITRGD